LVARPFADGRGMPVLSNSGRGGRCVTGPAKSNVERLVFVEINGWSGSNCVCRPSRHSRPARPSLTGH